MIRTVSEAVTQIDIARRADLDPSTVSYLMAILAERDLIDRAPDRFGTAWRILLTDQGQALLADTRTIAIRHGFVSPP
jgi:DNA-binding MarR family transcriptional regulator